MSGTAVASRKQAETVGSCASMDSLPIIDLSNSDRVDNAKRLVQAMETAGFVYLDNVPGFDRVAEETLLKAATWFFSQSLEEKLRCSPKRWNDTAPGVYRGYVPLDVDNGHMREQYETGETLPDGDPDLESGNPLYEPTPWPSEGLSGAAEFRRVMEAHRLAMVNAGMEVIRLSAIGLGMDEHAFDRKFFPKSISSLRIMHYPTYKPQESVLTCEEHCDSGFVTLLVTFSFPGLEYLREDGTWASIAPRPGSLVVNIGELLARLTNGRLKATYHRVRDIGKKRYSSPFFFCARSNAVFEMPDDGSKIVYGPFIIGRMRRHNCQYEHVPDFSHGDDVIT